LALSADALAPCFLLCHLDNFIVTQSFTAIYRDSLTLALYYRNYLSTSGSVRAGAKNP
jgi:hypothetical protein